MIPWLCDLVWKLVWYTPLNRIAFLRVWSTIVWNKGAWIRHRQGRCGCTQCSAGRGEDE